MGIGKGGEKENADLCERREEQAGEGRKDDRLLEVEKIMDGERKDWCKENWNRNKHQKTNRNE